MTKHTVGIDISKAWLDAFAAPEGRASRFSNDPTGFRKLIAWIGSEIDRIAYEPTGPFHRDFEDTLLKAGLPLYPINSFQVRSFARSLGGRAKTDAVDARMLATMAAAIEVAIRYNPDLKRKYEALVANGKPRKVALTAVMRKLLVLANTLVQQDRIWTAHAPGKYCCPVFPTPCQASSGHS